MARHGITREEVARAVHSLRAARRAASPTTVRLEIGTGSYSTICRHLRALGVRELKREGAAARTSDELELQAAFEEYERARFELRLALQSIRERRAAVERLLRSRNDALAARIRQRLHEDPLGACPGERDSEDSRPGYADGPVR
jgi:hypothetical protein